MNPQILKDAYDRVDFDRELVFQFFISFSLFEKALKENGFLHEAQNGDIQPDWEGFARTLDAQFAARRETPDQEKLNAAVDYFITQPTEKQVFRNNRIQFEPTGRSGPSDTVWISVLIRRVRNNLFHGGKFSYDRPRDTLLIENSLIILEEWAVLHPGVQRTLQAIF